MANRDWSYDYESLPYVFSDNDCQRVADRLQQRYSALAKQWNPEINSEWTCRLYLAAKLVMSATLHVNSASYAESRNLRVVLPYLHYYSVFCHLQGMIREGHAEDFFGIWSSRQDNPSGQFDPNAMQQIIFEIP